MSQYFLLKEGFFKLAFSNSANLSSKPFQKYWIYLSSRVCNVRLPFFYSRCSVLFSISILFKFCKLAIMSFIYANLFEQESIPVQALPVQSASFYRPPNREQCACQPYFHLFQQLTAFRFQPHFSKVGVFPTSKEVFSFHTLCHIS